MNTGKYYLSTYDSKVMYCLGYALDHKAASFSKKLNEYVEKFATDVGINADDVYWEYVLVSDWCRYMIILHAEVPTDWQPIEGCFIFGDTYCPNWRPELCLSITSLIVGNGNSVNIVTNPPTRPHNLFRTKIRS